MSISKTNFNDLSNDLITHISTYLSPQDRGRCARVCKYFKDYMMQTKLSATKVALTSKIAGKLIACLDERTKAVCLVAFPCWRSIFDFNYLFLEKGVPDIVGAFIAFAEGVETCRVLSDASGACFLQVDARIFSLSSDLQDAYKQMHMTEKTWHENLEIAGISSHDVGINPKLDAQYMLFKHFENLVTKSIEEGEIVDQKEKETLIPTFIVLRTYFETEIEKGSSLGEVRIFVEQMRSLYR